MGRRRQAIRRGSLLSACLGESEGFRVDSPDGRVGFVEDILFEGGRPETLVVRAGRLGRRLLLVSTENVEQVVPRRKRIVLHGSPRLVAAEPRSER